jgi:hydrogenase nickel incorporation protein HypA/HybF
MHELFIAESIAKSVLETLPDGVDSNRVLIIDLHIGQLDAVVNDSLLFLFDAIKGTKGLRMAQLRITTIAIVCQCRRCAHSFEIEMPLFVCPSCRSADVEVLKGRGITIQRIEIEDP